MTQRTCYQRLCKNPPTDWYLGRKWCWKCYLIIKAEEKLHFMHLNVVKDSLNELKGGAIKNV